MESGFASYSILLALLMIRESFELVLTVKEMYQDMMLKVRTDSTSDL